MRREDRVNSRLRPCSWKAVGLIPWPEVILRGSSVQEFGLPPTGVGWT